MRGAPHTSLVRRLAVWIVSSAMLGVVVPARAQDDWSLTRTPSGSTRPRPHPRAHPGRPRTAPTASGALVDRYREMAMRDPSETFALTRWVALASERDGSTAPLHDEMRALADADPSAITPRLVLAHLARRAGHFDEARALYREVELAHPDDPTAGAELARTEREAGAMAAARQAYDVARARAHGPLAEALAREELEVLVDLGDVDSASALDAVIAGARPSIERRLELPRAWLAHQRPEAAVAMLDAIEPRVAGDPRALVPLRMIRARAELALGHTPLALAAIDSVLQHVSGGLRNEAYELAYEAHRQADTLDALATRLAHERTPEAAALLARVEDERGHDDAAIAAYDRAIAAHPRDGGLRERRAHVLLRSGRVDEAARGLEALWRASPDEPDRLIEAATVLVDAGREQDARALLAAASASRPRDARLHRRLAEVFARWGDDDRALAEAQALARLEPDEPDSHALVGDLLLARGDRQGALAELRRMLPHDASAADHDRLAQIFADHDLLDDARIELGEALRIAPDDRDARQHLADVLVRSGRDAEAEPLAAAIVREPSGDPAQRREARAGLVSIWARRRTLERHVEQLEASFAASPDLASGSLLAEALRRDGNLPRAEEVLEQLASLAPDDVDTWTTLERVRTLRGDLIGAIEALEEASRADPPRAASYLARMSESALALYRDDDAIRYAERALALAPNDARGHARLGDLHRRRQELTEAAASYRRALALDPSSFGVALTLAEITRSAGDADGADTLYAHVIEQSPDDDFVSRAIDASLEIELARGNAEPLLDRLLTLAVAHYDRPVLARSALAVLDAIASPLVPRAETDPTAQNDLHRIASRGLGVLLRALASADPSEEQTALAILSTARIEAAAPALLAASEAHHQGTLGLDALTAAARVAGADLVPRLLEIARGSDTPRARIATWGLGRIGDAAAVHGLSEIAIESSDIGALAALALAHLGQPVPTSTGSRSPAIALAHAALDRAPTPTECATLAETAGTSRAVGWLACAEPTEIAGALLSGTDPEGAIRAATHDASDLLRAWPEPRPGEAAVSTGLRAIDRTPARAPSSAVRAALGRAIVDGLASAAPAATLRALGTREGHLVLVAFEGDASGTLLDDAPVVAALPAAAPDPGDRARVARLLASTAPSDARLPLLVADGDREVVRAAVDGLTSAGRISPSLVAPLATILTSSPDWVSRLGAARALASTADGAESALIHALASDSFAFVREAAAGALAVRTDGPSLVALQTAAGSDPEERVRAAALTALTLRSVAVR